MLNKIIHSLRMKLDPDYRAGFLRRQKFARIMAANQAIITGK